ncbi:MAG: hypothetical protein JXR03_01210 [Cyclobacteriaceae bacterium]
MENYFLEKFKSKSKHELELIVANQANYQPEAVRAAIELLNNNHELEIPTPQQAGATKELSEDSNFGVLSLSFDYKPFFRTLSYREFVTSFALALLYHSLFEIIDYYSNERFFENSLRAWKLSFFVVVFLGNHIIYRFEHRRSNNFISRSLSDLILLIILILSRVGYELILDSNYRLNLDANGVGVFFIIFGIVIMIFALETAVALLKFLLKRIRCQVF